MTTPSQQDQGSTVRAILRNAFSFPVLLGVLLVGAALMFARSAGLTVPVQEAMLHAKIGKDILATHVFPTTDSYSFTAQGGDCIAFEWLSDLLMALAERRGGLVGLMWLVSVLVGTATLLLYYLAYGRCGNSKAAFLACVPVLPLMSPFFYLRAQLLGTVFLLVTLICLQHFRQGKPKALWILPPLFLIWVNTHASFIFGLFALGLYWASGLTGFCAGGLRAERWTTTQRLQLLSVALFSVLALTVSPYGTRMAAFPLEVLHVPVGTALIDEYQPLGAVPVLLTMFLALFLPFVLALLLVRPGYRLDEIALLFVGVYAGCAHRRLLVLFVLAFAPMLAVLLARWVPTYRAAKDKYLLNAVLMLSVLAMVKAVLTPQEVQARVAKAYPVRAAEYLRRHSVPGPMFNEDSWGDYLIWKFDGEHKVFVDTRTVLYEESGVFQDYARIMYLDQDVQSLLRKYGIESCLIDRTAALATLLAALPDWKKVYGDELVVIFVRESPALAYSHRAQPVSSHASAGIRGEHRMFNNFCRSVSER